MVKLENKGSPKRKKRTRSEIALLIQPKNQPIYSDFKTLAGKPSPSLSLIEKWENFKEKNDCIL